MPPSTVDIAVFNSPWAGLIPTFKRLYQYNRLLHGKQLGSETFSSICQRADLKSIFEKIFKPASFALNVLVFRN